LPDYYQTVCGGQGSRIWVDLGSGPGGLGLALLEKLRGTTMVLVALFLMPCLYALVTRSSAKED
jgi:hypothetical protein